LVTEIVQGERRRLAVVKSDVAASPFAALADSAALQSA
jgi:hypothetical protein